MKPPRAAHYWSLAAIILAVYVLGVALMGSVTEKRKQEIEIDDCLDAGKRAVMICSKGMRCYIECREPVE